MCVGEEGAEERAAALRPARGARATAARGAAQHPQVRDRAVLEDPAAQRQGTQELCHLRRPQEAPGDPRRAGLRARRVRARNQQLLPGGDRQVLFAGLRAAAARPSLRLQPAKRLNSEAFRETQLPLRIPAAIH